MTKLDLAEAMRLHTSQTRYLEIHESPIFIGESDIQLLMLQYSLPRRAHVTVVVGVFRVFHSVR